ncbi:RNA polymerase sigma factor [Sorangium sp. So ce327]|jgi:RNA polymerase sigma-70 factor (ECF subfamily)|uniref:RNA polymerase sigma factor n=1 Tax=Sorangium sp. So ce327 TaxID=3133301 RepID=UPI003F5ECD74
MGLVASLSEVWMAAPALAVQEGEDPVSTPVEGAEPAARRRALEALYAAHARAIHRFLCDLLGDTAAAADATQETFVRAMRRLHTLETPERPAPWLFGIARHVSLEHRRARRRRRQVLDDGPLDAWEERPAACAARAPGAPRTPEDELMGREALTVLAGALDQLGEDRRAALLLRLDHGLSYEEIARLMEWSLPKVKVEIHRARQELRAELVRYDGGGR